MKAKRSKKKDAMKGPEKFIKSYRAAQKSYKYYKNKVYIFRILDKEGGSNENDQK